MAAKNGSDFRVGVAPLLLAIQQEEAARTGLARAALCPMRTLRLILKRF